MAEQAGRDTAHLAQGRNVLVIQDSSNIVVGGRKAREAGFGPVGKGGQLGGLCLHALLAVDAGTGAVLGPVDIAVTNRTGGPKQTHYTARALSERESQRWLDGARTASRVLAQAAHITVVADRESDIYQGYAQRPANVHLLTRMARDRRILTQEGKSQLLYAFSDTLPVCRTIQVTIPAAPGRKERRTRLQLRFAPVTVRRPQNVKDKETPRTLTLNLVDIREVGAPATEDAIHWRLLTTHAVSTFTQAVRMLALYRKRWLIEEYFKVLKTGGMDIENARIEKPATMINLTGAAGIAAATIMKLKQARDGLTDDGLETVFDEDDELLFEALTLHLEGNTLKQKNPHRPGTLARAQWVIARLGGWNCYYGKPGPKTYSRGLAKFHDIKLGNNLLKRDV
jgi:hypothetical protein